VNRYKIRKANHHTKGQTEAGFDFGDGTQHPYRYDPHHVINHLIKTRSKVGRTNNYLEIGVDQGYTFDQVESTDIKHGVDPYGASTNITHRLSSQMFFSLNSYFFKQTYDIIFIDGIHLFPFIQQEIKDSLSILSDDGVILLHDTCPLKKSAQDILWSDFEKILENVISNNEKDRLKWHENTKKNQPVGYNGDAWKNAAWYRCNTDLTTFSIPDACISVISKKHFEGFSSKKTIKEIKFDKMTWSLYYNCFHEIMNPVSFEYYKENISMEKK
jgi:hypothetical protein